VPVPEETTKDTDLQDFQAFARPVPGPARGDRQPNPEPLTPAPGRAVAIESPAPTHSPGQVSVPTTEVERRLTSPDGGCRPGGGRLVKGVDLKRWCSTDRHSNSRVVRLAANGYGAYRYRTGGRASKRVQRGGFASKQDAHDALERELERLRRERRITRRLTLSELVETYLGQHDRLASTTRYDGAKSSTPSSPGRNWRASPA
jgi:hypothetical protein